MNKLLCIVCLSFQFFSYNSLAYSSDELCYDEPIDIKISDKNKSKINDIITNIKNRSKIVLKFIKTKYGRKIAKRKYKIQLN